MLDNVSRASKVLVYNRGTFYHFKELYETGGVDPVSAKLLGATSREVMIQLLNGELGIGEGRYEFSEQRIYQ
jgi:hypothetical protein